MTREIKNVKEVWGFDLDGVIIDHATLKQKIAQRYGFALKLEETRSDIMRQLLPGDIVGRISQEIYCEHSSQPLIAGARKKLEKTKASDVPFFLISRRRTGKAREAAVEILKKQGLWPEFFNEKNTFFVGSPEEKNEVAQKLGITHYVDDEEAVLGTMESVPHKFLFNQFAGGWDNLN